MASMGTKKKKIQAPNLTGNAHLENSPVNLLSLREHGRNEISTLLSRVEGKSKHLIWDSSLIGPLNYIIQTKMLNNLGIAVRTTLNVKSSRISSDCDSIIYLAYPNSATMKAISSQIVSHSKGRKKNFYLLLMPRSTFLSRRCLEMYGAYGSLHVFDLNIEWYPIEADVISLEKPNCLYELLHGNVSSLMDIARALTSLQAVFGRFPIVRSKGDLSCAVVDIMKRLMLEDGDIYASSDGNISQCIIIDRSVDMVTPCLTPRTYEGLLDEVFGIENSIIRVSKSLLGKSAQKTKTKTAQLNLVLNSSDSTFKQIRDTSFRYLGKLLSHMAEAIRQGYDDRHKAKTSKELNAYIKKFKAYHADHSLVEQHVHLADYVSSCTSKKMKWKRKMEHEFALLCNEAVPNGSSGEEYLDEMIGSGASIERVLQFMILITLTQGGCASKYYDQIKRNIIQAYGIQHLATLDLLEKYGLISYSSTLKRLYSSQKDYLSWSNVKRQFHLVRKKEELDLILTKQANKRPTQQEIAEMVTNPSVLGQYDINLIGGYSNGGYAPLSARLVEAATRVHGWKAIQQELRELKGKSYINETMTTKTQKDHESDKTAQQKSDAMSAHKTVLVFFVGGVTYAEISAIRMLEQRPNTPWKFIVATTNIARGSQIINAFIDKDLK